MIDRGFCTMIMKNMRPAIPLLLLAALPAWGDAVSLSFNQHATKNVFQTSDAVADQISVFSLAFDKDLSALSLLGRAEYSAFNQTSGMSFFAAEAGIDYLVPASRKSAFYFAAGGTGEIYRQTYEAFNSLGANLLGAFKTYLAPSSILKLQWQGRYAAYKDPLFDFLSQTLSLSVDKYFPSRTTLKADAGWGYKYFLHPFLPEPAEPAAVTALMSGGNSGGAGTGGRGTGGGGRAEEAAINTRAATASSPATAARAAGPASDMCPCRSSRPRASAMPSG